MSDPDSNGAFLPTQKRIERMKREFREAHIAKKQAIDQNYYKPVGSGGCREYQSYRGGRCQRWYSL